MDGHHERPQIDQREPEKENVCPWAGMMIFDHFNT